MKRLALSFSCVATGLLCFIPMDRVFGFYDPAVQRRINRDPIQEGGFELSLVRPRDSIDVTPANLYGYVNNNPVGELDPLGLIGVCICNFQIAQVFPPLCDRFCLCLSTTSPPGPVWIVSSRSAFNCCFVLLRQPVVFPVP